MKKLLFIPALFLILASCAEEETPPDYFSDSEGNYSYSVGITSTADRNITTTDNGSLKINVQNDGSLQLLFDENTAGELIFTTKNEVQTSNGYVFDIDTKSMIDSDGDNYNIRGYDGSSFESEGYHGRFDIGSNQLYLNFYTDYVVSDYDVYNAEYVIIATKN